MAKILLVEDDKLLTKSIVKFFGALNHAVDSVETGADASEFLKTCTYDLIILDWDLPDGNGVDVCRQFRDDGGKTPVLFLTGRSNIGEKKQGFTAGADDYLTKPFDMQELEMRFNALLRRPPGLVAKHDLLTYDDIVVDVALRQVTSRGALVKLVPKEFALLEFLMRHPKTVFSAQTLLDRIWKADADVAPDAVRIYVTRLRQKLDAADKPSIIETVHGVGYRLR